MAATRTVALVVCIALASLAHDPARFPMQPPLSTPELHAQELTQELTFQNRRIATVDAAGWQALPPDPEMLAAAREGSLRIYDPQDREVPFVLTSPASVSRELAVEIEDVVPADGGWHIVLDLGPSPPAHDRLEVGLTETGVVGAVDVAGSDDLDIWRPLGTGRVFRLGPGTELEGTEVRYASTTARYLRVTWPTESAPEVNRIQARAAEPSASARAHAVRLDARTTRPGSATYDLTLPAANLPVRTLVVDLERPGSAGVRLFAPSAGAWQLVWEGVVDSDAEDAGRIELEGWHPQSTRLRLSMYAGGDIDVVVAGAHLEVAPHWLVFEAPAAGGHTIAYAGVGIAPPTYPRLRFPEPVQSLPEPALRESVRQDLPSIPEALARLGPAIERTSFRLTVPLSADTVSDGDLVVATIPADAYAAAVSSRLTDLRVLADGGQAPFVLHRPPEPSLVSETEPERPQEQGAGHSRVTVELDHTQLPLTTLELTAPAAPFVRPVQVRFVAANGSGGESPQRAAQAQWRCPGFAPLPCRLALDLPANRHRRMEVMFDDGDNPPLPEVTVRVWRATDEVRFPWPGGDPVLAVGNPELGPPRYDLEQVADEVRTRPAAPVTVGAAAAPEAPFDLDRSAFLAAIALGALALIAVLVRTVVRTSGEPSEP